jgi:hypothetical protein
VQYEWDPRKASSNRQKHGIDIADAIGVFEDPLAITVEDNRHKESRYVTIGTDFLGRLLIVTYTWRGEKIRVVSARKATSSERRQYEG